VTQCASSRLVMRLGSSTTTVSPSRYALTVLRRRGLRTTLTSGFAVAAGERSGRGEDLAIVATSIPCLRVRTRANRRPGAAVTAASPGGGGPSPFDAPSPFDSKFFLCPQAGRIRQAGHRHDQFAGLHLLSPAAGRLSTEPQAVVHSIEELSPGFSTGSRTGALTPCGDRAIVLATRPPTAQRPSLSKGKAEREPATVGGFASSGAPASAGPWR
jgi:hypothetical protein